MLARHLAGDGGDDEVVAIHQEDDHATRLDESAAPLDDQLQNALEADLSSDRLRDLGGRLEASHCALELGAAVALAAVEASILDGGGGPGRQDDDRFLIGLVEFALLLVRQVEVPPRFTANQERYSEEAAHRRVADREPVGLGVCSDIREPQGARVIDQHAQDAATAGKVADLPLQVGVDPGRDEALERPAILPEHADCRVARAGEVGRGLEHVRRTDSRSRSETSTRPTSSSRRRRVRIEGGLGHASPIIRPSQLAPANRVAGT